MRELCCGPAVGIRRTGCCGCCCCIVFRSSPITWKTRRAPSTQIELQTMVRIGADPARTHPHTRDLLRPFAGRRGSRHRAETRRSPKRCGRSAGAVYIGDQYAWLPAYCKQHAIVDMELGVHVDDKVQALVRPYAMEFEHPAGYRSVRVDPRHADTAEFRLFGRFSFPLFHIDKVGMDREAEAEGWSEIMDMTWFCHTPVRGRPCGFCAPCVYTIKEGLARRVPPSRRALSFFYRRLALPLKDSVRRVRAIRQEGAEGRAIRRRTGA